MAVENDLGRDEVKKLVWRIAIPSMLGQFVSVLYSIVDRIYIGNIPEVGDLALAGVGVCGPVVTMVGSVAFLIGVGGAPMVSIRMGERNFAEARKVLANCFLMLCVFSVLLVGGILPFQEPMLRLFGASDATYPYAQRYFTAYLCGTFFALAATGLNQFVICQGFAKAGMKSVILGAALNIILDPVFIFVLDLGVTGAAVATVISQAAGAGYVLRFLFGKKAMVPITFGGYDLRIMGRVMVLGFTPFLIIAIDNVMIIAMNAVLQQFGGPERGGLPRHLQYDCTELHASGHHAPGRHQRRDAGNFGVQLRGKALRPGFEGAEIYRRPVRGLHGGAVCAGKAVRPSLCAAVHTGRLSGGAGV